MTLRNLPSPRARRTAFAVTVLFACAAFAFWPLRPIGINTPVIERTQSPAKQVVALDTAAFRAPIWVAEPPPPPPPAPIATPPPPPPLRLQLLAIIRESDAYKAAIYDPDTDRILVVAAGEKLGTRTVERVDKATLMLRDQAGMRVLALKEGGAP